MSNFTGKKGSKKINKKKNLNTKIIKIFFLAMKYGQKNWEQKRN